MKFLQLEHLLQLGLGLWLALLLFLIVGRILRGEIGLGGLLTTSTTNGRVIDPERVVALATFVFVLGTYALKAIDADVTAGTEDPPRMPDVPASVVAVLAGSNTLYLAGKIMRLR